MPWKALRQECVRQWRIENISDEVIPIRRLLSSTREENLICAALGAVLDDLSHLLISHT